MPYTILVCDDDDDIAEALSIYLRAEGYAVLRAANGLEALQAVEQVNITLILLDVMMPVISSLSAG